MCVPIDLVGGRKKNGRYGTVEERWVGRKGKEESRERGVGGGASLIVAALVAMVKSMSDAGFFWTWARLVLGRRGGGAEGGGGGVGSASAAVGLVVVVVLVSRWMS